MSFVCSKCGACCKDSGNEKGLVIIYPCEVERLSENLGCTKDEFFRKYCIKDHLIFDETKYVLYKLKKRNDQCVFLNNNLCSIYSFKPIQCEKAPFHYFANSELWNHMPCITDEQLIGADSKEEDIDLVRDLMNGYR